MASCDVRDGMFAPSEAILSCTSRLVSSATSFQAAAGSAVSALIT